VDRPSSTFSSEARSRWPLAGLCALALLGVLELAVRIWFQPPHVALATYAAYYPLAMRYGADGTRACFRVRNEFSCISTQDMNIIPQTFAVKKPPHELRIVVIGASVSWEGPRPAQSEGNYPSEAIARLAAAHPAANLRLINLSVPGFGSRRELVRFREALEYEPDLFIIHIHDTNEIREEQRSAYVAQLHAGLAGKLLYLQSVVVLKHWWSNQLGIHPPRAAAEASAEGEPETKSAQLARFLVNLEQNEQRMLDLARARSIPVILVAATRADTHDLQSVNGRSFNAFQAEHANGQVQFVDVPALFLDERAHGKRRLFKDGIHYSAAGIRVVARAVAERIELALPALSR